MFFAPFVVLLCSARPCQSSFALQPLTVSTHHARPYIVFIWYAHLCSPYTIKSARVSPIFCHPCSPLILRAPLQSPFAPQPQESPPCQTTLCSLYIPERLCSLRVNKSGKVFAYSFALAVSIHCAHLNSPTTSRAPISLHLFRVPLRSWCDLCPLAPCAHSWRAGGIGLYMIYFCTAGRCPNQWAVHCRHVRRSHRRYTQIYSRRV